MDTYPAWRRRLITTSLPLLFVIYAVTYGGLQWLFGNYGDSRLHRLTAIGATIEGVLFATIMTVVTYYARRRFVKQTDGKGTAKDLLELRIHVQKGIMPTDQRIRDMLPEFMIRQERLNKCLLWIGPIEFGFFTILSLSLAYFDHETVFYLFAIMFIGFGIFIDHTGRRNLRNITKLRGELNEAL